MLDDKEIVAAYQTVLGREPDPQGFETFRELGRQGLTVGELRDLLEGSDELRARRVAALFALAYGRAADAYELDQLNAYVAQVGATSGRDLLKATVATFSRTSHPTSILMRLAPEDLGRVPIPSLDATLILDRYDWSMIRMIGDGDYEPHLGAYIRRVLKDGMVAIDVGANVGAHMLAMSRLVGSQGHVYAFEPSSENCRALMLTIRENALVNVELIPVALSDRLGAVAFTQAIGGNGGFLYHVEDPLLHPTCSVVPTVPLDQLIDPRRLDFMKVDVEGAEHLVIGGAMRLIERHRPVIVAEFSVAMLAGVSQVSGPDYLRRILSLGYHAQTLGLSGPVTRIEDPDIFLQDWPDQFRIEDIAFVPVERSAELIDGV